MRFVIKRTYMLVSIYVLSIFFWIYAFIFIVSNLAPYNTTSYKVTNENDAFLLKNFLPEGFGYFTRNPIEEFPLLYELENEKLKLITVANSAPSNLFGIKRSQRALFSELSQIISEIGENDWNKCSSTFYDCISNKSVHTYEISNNKDYPLICGEFYVSSSKPIPYAWRKNFDKEMPLRFLKIIVSCDN